MVLQKPLMCFKILSWSKNARHGALPRPILPRSGHFFLAHARYEKSTQIGYWPSGSKDRNYALKLYFIKSQVYNKKQLNPNLCSNNTWAFIVNMTMNFIVPGDSSILLWVHTVRNTAQENVMNAHRKSVYSLLWLINLKI